MWTVVYCLSFILSYTAKTDQNRNPSTDFFSWHTHSSSVFMSLLVFYFSLTLGANFLNEQYRKLTVYIHLSIFVHTYFFIIIRVGIGTPIFRQMYTISFQFRSHLSAPPINSELRKLLSVMQSAYILSELLISLIF